MQREEKTWMDGTPFPKWSPFSSFIQNSRRGSSSLVIRPRCTNTHTLRFLQTRTEWNAGTRGRYILIIVRSLTVEWLKAKVSMQTVKGTHHFVTLSFILRLIGNWPLDVDHLQSNVLITVQSLTNEWPNTLIVRRFNLGLFRWFFFSFFRFPLQNWSWIPNAEAYKRFGVFWGGLVGCQMGGTPINNRCLLLPHNRKLDFKCWNMSENLVPCRHELPLVIYNTYTYMPQIFTRLCVNIFDKYWNN
jgi:hypothetical protein